MARCRAAWIAAAHLKSDQFLFPSRVSASPHLSTRQYSRIVGGWAGSIGLDLAAYGTHSLRLGRESGERRAGLIWHPKASLRGREPSGNPRRESVHTREQRLRMGRRRKFFERRLMLPATCMQHAR